MLEYAQFINALLLEVLMATEQTYVSQTGSRSISVNKVLKNTYMLLAMTLMFSAAVAFLSMKMGWPHPGLIGTLVGFYGLLFLTHKFENSGLGILFVFALTGFMGLTIGPIISHFLTAVPNGHQIVVAAMATTGITFVGLSAYIIVTGKNMAFMGGMLFAGILAVFLLMIGNIFFQSPALQLAVSALFVLLMSGLIMYQTSEIIHGGETNYIRATTTLFVSIYNLFQSLLMIFGVMGGDD